MQGTRILCNVEGVVDGLSIFAKMLNGVHNSQILIIVCPTSELFKLIDNALQRDNYGTLLLPSYYFHLRTRCLERNV